ncbi:MAG: hypothetical protein IJJ82_04125 [Clostridia bacterium]|nr:hypothetical protein [Clostridia bacterium]
MKNLDDYLNSFKNEKQSIPHSFTNTIKNFSPSKKESRYWIMRLKGIKKSIIVATSLLLGSGVVFAGSKVVENIWKQPETYEYTQKITQKDKEEAISEDEAKEKAIEYLNRIQLNKEVGKLKLTKTFRDNELVWSVGFNGGVLLLDKSGNIKSINIPSFEYKIPYNYGITREEARKVAKELLKKYNPNDNSDEYELVSLKRNSEEDKEAYIWYADFYKKYGDLYNQYETISIGWIPTINGLYSLRFENSKYENNEQIISKEEAIKIATEKDKQIEKRYNILSSEAEIGIDKMNTEVVYREKDIENYEKGTINFNRNENGQVTVKDDAVFYKVDNRVRKVWEVTIYYDHYKYDYPERFVYFVDSTTGEIIGGDRWNGTTNKIKDLKSDPYNVIEKN